MMKTYKQHNAPEVIKIERLKRRMFTLKLEAEVVRQKKAKP